MRSLLFMAAIVTSIAATASCARSGGAETTRSGRGRSYRRGGSGDPRQSVQRLGPHGGIRAVPGSGRHGQVSGYIKQIKVDIGDRIQEGQLLATLEIPEMQDDLTRAAATIAEANAELATARDEVQRAESAHAMAHLSYSRILDVSKREPELVPQQEVDETHSRDLVAEAQVSATKSHVIACEQRIRVAQAEQGRFKTLYQYGVITAPFTGVVTKRYANSGSLIQAGTTSQTQAMPVVRLSENGLLRLALPVPESGGTFDPSRRAGGCTSIGAASKFSGAGWLDSPIRSTNPLEP